MKSHVSFCALLGLSLLFVGDASAQRRGAGSRPAPRPAVSNADSDLDAGERAWLEYILDQTEGAREKREVAEYFRQASPAARLKFYEDVLKEATARSRPTTRPAPRTGTRGGSRPSVRRPATTGLTAEESYWLEYIVRQYDGAKAKQEAREYFYQVSSAERKRFYDDVRRDAGDMPAPKATRSSTGRFGRGGPR